MAQRAEAAEAAGSAGASARGPESGPEGPLPGTTRREFLKFAVVGGSTLVVGGSFVSREVARAQVDPPDLFDVGDFLVAAELPYNADTLVLEVTAHNRVRFELPRLDKGQGIVTAMAMLIAEEMDADYDRCDVELMDASADRPYSLTGYSSTVRVLWDAVRQVSAEARARLVTAAAERWGLDAATLTTSKSMVIAPDGRRASYGELTAEAAQVAEPLLPATPKDPATYSQVVGQARGRKNARDIVTGAHQYTLDRELPGAVHAVVARPPDIYGTVAAFDATAALALPNVEGVVQIPQIPHPAHDALEGGVAVAARTIHEAFQARDALDITWAPGPLAGVSDADLRAQLVANAQPLLTPPVPGASIDASFDYPYVNHATLEVQTAAAHVVGDTAEVWFPTQTPLLSKQLVGTALGIPEANVTLHVTPCGGSFGRHLFSEAAIEAALVSQALGKPVKLMWSRNDDMRNGRFRPMSHHDLRAVWEPLTGTMLAYEHNVSAAETDFRHALGEAMSAGGWDAASLQLNQSVFEGSVVVPYDFGVKEQRLTETTLQVPTCSWRSIYSGFTTASNEIFVDEIARAQGVDEVAFRDQYTNSDAARACLAKVAELGDWGRAMPTGHAQGVALHVEYRSAVAYLVEIDASDPAAPRLTRAFVAVDVGIPINPKGLEAQLQGALIDGWTVMFRAGNHLDDGRIREGSYGDFLWARMNHAPVTTEVFVFPSNRTTPGGCGELGYPPAAAACVNAYARATGTAPRQFPIGEFV